MVFGKQKNFIGAAIFSALKNEESEVFHKATHDFLIGISNRSLFYDRIRQRLSQVKRKNEKFGIIMLDMDGLKETNDNYGHRTGDAAIKADKSMYKRKESAKD